MNIATVVEGPTDRLALKAIVNHLYPGEHRYINNKTFVPLPLALRQDAQAQFLHIARMAGDVFLEAGEVVAVVEAAGEEGELFVEGGGNGEVFGVAPDHAEGVDQVAEEDGGFQESGVVGRGDDVGGGQGFHSLVGIGMAEAGVELAVADLEALNEIFHIHQAAGTELGIDGAGGNQVAELSLPHSPHGGDIKGFTRVDQAVAELDDLLPELKIAGDGAELDQGLPLVGPGFAAGTEIILKPF